MPDLTRSNLPAKGELRRFTSSGRKLMNAWTRSYGLAGVVVALGAGLIGLAGCRHMGGCCGGCSDGRCATAAASPMAGTAPVEVPGGVASAFGGQKTCPVSGAALGSNSVAVPVQGETVFVCCADCA